MSDQQQNSNELAISNYRNMQAMAKNEKTIMAFTAVLGSKTSARAYISSALLAVANNNALMECTPASVMQVALRAATLRLSCDPALGQAYPVPYNDRKKGKVATLQIGYKGVQQMALRTNKYRFLNPGELYEGQIIERNQLTGAVRIAGQRVSDKVIGYFHYFEYFNGYSSFLYMTNEELWAHAERYSKSYQNDLKYHDKKSLWNTEFEKMAKKTVTRLNILRNGTLTTEDAAVVAAMDEDAETLDGEVIDTTFEDIKPTEEELKAAERPQQTIEKNMADLGFEPEKKAEVPKPEPEIISGPDMTIEQAEAEESTTYHTLYGYLPTEKLDVMRLGMRKAKNPTPDQARKIKAVTIILEARAKGRPVMEPVKVEPEPEETDVFAQQEEIPFDN